MSEVSEKIELSVESARKIFGVGDGFIKKVERELSNQGRHTYLYAPDSSHGVKGVIRHLNDAGILVLFAANSSIDTSVFDTTRGYYSNWFDKNMTVEEVASFIYRASSIHGDTAILGDYI